MVEGWAFPWGRQSVVWSVMLLVLKLEAWWVPLSVEVLVSKSALSSAALLGDASASWSGRLWVVRLVVVWGSTLERLRVVLLVERLAWKSEL
jgi:hypothetical protein